MLEPLFEHTVVPAEVGLRGRQSTGSLGPVEAVANFGWAADVGEVVGGPMAAHNKHHCFPILS